MTHARRVGSIEPRSAPSPSGRRHTTLARLIGAVGLVLLTVLLYWMLTDDTFRVEAASVRFEGLAHADETAVRAQLSDIDRRPNVFRVRATDIVSELSTLTEVDAAYATVTLPADVTVQLDERDPVFIWTNGERSWLVDEEGMLFAPADEATAQAVADARAIAAGEPSEAEDAAAADSGGETAASDTQAPDALLDPEIAARATLPRVEDARLPVEEPTVGTHLDPADLAIMRQLLALTPELLDSRARRLRLRVDAADGYVLESEDRGWRAQFGHYTPTLQPPTDIPRQVQCLRSLLAQEEPRLVQARLALSEGACGTFTTIR